MCSQILHRGTEHKAIKHCTKAAAVTAHRGSGDAKAKSMGPVVEDLRPRAGDGVVRFVNNDEIGLPGLQLEAAGECLHRRDLHRVIRRLEAGGDDAMLDAGPGELCARLADQLTPMHKDQHTTTTLNSASSDGGEHDGLATASGQHQQRRACA